MGTLELRNIAKRYGALTIIDDLSLDIEQGQFVVLVGPSGCGKSTVLRMIAGLEDISGGDLIIDGKRANDTPPQKRDISMVFQSYALFPHMSVHDNIAFGPQVRGEDKEETEKRIQKASEVLNLKNYLDRLPGQLSGGQRQRVAMGRAIVRDPKLFLFDEPLSNLDAKLRVQMRAEIKALHQKLQTTIVYVTHDQIEAMTMADVIVVMKDGEIMQAGHPLDIYDNPNNAFVAGFIGSPAMGFIKCEYEAQSKSAILPNKKALKIGADNAKDGQELLIGIRPENFQQSEDGPIEMTVEVVEPTGSEVHIVGFVGENEVRCVFRERFMPKAGEVIKLSAEPSAIHVFDEKSGNRV